MGWSMDFTGPQMILTLKLIALAFSYSDGRNCAAKDLTPQQQAKALRTLPSPLEYFGFVYFYPSFLAGPYLEYMDYQRYIDGSQFQDKARITTARFPSESVFSNVCLCARACARVRVHVCACACRASSSEDNI